MAGTRLKYWYNRLKARPTGPDGMTFKLGPNRWSTKSDRSSRAVTKRVETTRKDWNVWDEMRMMRLTANSKSYGVLDTSELPLNAYTNIVKNEFPEEKLAWIRKGKMMEKKTPILDEGGWRRIRLLMNKVLLPGDPLRCVEQAETGG
jgi:hypothetical protein